MIDYEKLRQAYELTHRLPDCIWVAHHWTAHEDEYFRLHDNRVGVCDSGVLSFEDFESIDDLIAKLRELTKPEPKYAVGDIVWRYAVDNEFFECIVIKIYDIEECQYICRDAGDDFEDIYNESYLYPTREALIKAQIAYWEKMKGEL
jgi:hypothetical protein